MTGPRPHVVVTNWVHPEVLDYLRDGADVVANHTREPWPADEVLARARAADGLMTFMPDRVDEDFLAACPRLRVVACALKGFDNFDVDACTRRGVWLTVVPDLLTVPTAELAIALLLAVSRHVLTGDRGIRTSGFRGWRPLLYGRGLAGSTVGLVGMGKVGRAIAERLVGFQARIVYHDQRRLDPDEEARLRLRCASLREVLATSDFVILALPLTSETKHIIGPTALSGLKPGALLVNPARGSLVDEEAVADALADGRLAGYAADVFEMEDWARTDRPPAIPPRLRADEHRTVLTPHLGSAVDEARRAIALAAAHDLLAVFEGRVPGGAVNRPRMTPVES